MNSVWLRPIKTTTVGILDLLFPPSCLACHASLSANEKAVSLCDGCYADLNLSDDPVCMRCAEPVPTCTSPNFQGWPTDCACCREEKWHFDETISLGPYQGLLRYLVLQSKKQTGTLVARLLGQLLASKRMDRFQDLKEDTFVVPIPSHWTRRVFRGGNGPDRVAQGLASTRDLPTGDFLRRTVRTAKQTELPPHRRKANVRSAFQAKLPDKATGKTILLVDDVLTTGSTASEAARALKRAGAGRVVLVVAAKRIGWN